MIHPRNPLRKGYAGALLRERCRDCGEIFPVCLGQLVAKFPYINTEADAELLKFCPRCLDLDAASTPGGEEILHRYRQTMFEANFYHHAIAG